MGTLVVDSLMAFITGSVVGGYSRLDFRRVASKAAAGQVVDSKHFLDALQAEVAGVDIRSSVAYNSLLVLTVIVMLSHLGYQSRRQFSSHKTFKAGLAGGGNNAGGQLTYSHRLEYTALRMATLLARCVAEDAKDGAPRVVSSKRVLFGFLVESSRNFLAQAGEAVERTYRDAILGDETQEGHTPLEVADVRGIASVTDAVPKLGERKKLFTAY